MGIQNITNIVQGSRYEEVASKLDDQSMQGLLFHMACLLVHFSYWPSMGTWAMRLGRWFVFCASLSIWGLNPQHSLPSMALVSVITTLGHRDRHVLRGSWWASLALEANLSEKACLHQVKQRAIEEDPGHQPLSYRELRFRSHHQKYQSVRWQWLQARATKSNNLNLILTWWKENTDSHLLMHPHEYIYLI